MIIRRARSEDARAISRLKCETILRVNSKDYDKQHIHAWIVHNRTRNTRKSMAEAGREFYVAEEDEEIVGTVVLKPMEKMISGLYVRHTMLNLGIGSRLLRHAEDIARSRGIDRLYLVSTITAEDFYRRKGYRKTRQSVGAMQGLILPGMMMVKKL